MEITGLIDFLDSLFTPWGYHQKKPLLWYKKPFDSDIEQVILLEKRKNYKNAYQLKVYINWLMIGQPLEFNNDTKIKFAPKEVRKACLQLLNLNKKIPDAARTAQLKPFIQDYLLYHLERKQMDMTKMDLLELFINLFTAHGYKGVLSPQFSQANHDKFTPAMLHVRHKKEKVDYIYYFTHTGEVFTKTIALLLGEHGDRDYYVHIHYYFTIRELPLYGKHAHVYCHFMLPQALECKLRDKERHPFSAGEQGFLYRQERKELLTELTTTYLLKPLAEINSVKELLAHMKAKDIYVPWMIKEKYR